MYSVTEAEIEKFLAEGPATVDATSSATSLASIENEAIGLVYEKNCLVQLLRRDCSEFYDIVVPLAT